MAKSRPEENDDEPSDLAGAEEALEEDAADVKASAGDWLQALADLARATSAERGEVQQHVREKAEKFTKSLRNLEDDGEELVETVERNVREQPIMMLIGAFGVGILLGRLIRGK